MTILLSAKIITIMVLLMMIIIKLAHAQDDRDVVFDDEQPIYDDLQQPYCPEQLQGFYKECRGKIIPCVDCIQKAEKQCELAQIDLRTDGNCWDCTTLFAAKCEPAGY